MQALLTRKHAEEALMGKIHRVCCKSCVSEPVACQAYRLNDPP